MIRHIAMLQWKDGTTTAQVDAVEQALRRMPDVMPFIRRYELGRDLGVNGSHDFVVTAEFDSIEDYQTYSEQADHREVLSSHIAPILADLARIQIEL
jgi:hypothetical protein